MGERTRTIPASEPSRSGQSRTGRRRGRSDRLNPPNARLEIHPCLASPHRRRDADRHAGVRRRATLLNAPTAAGDARSSVRPAAGHQHRRATLRPSPQRRTTPRPGSTAPPTETTSRPTTRGHPGRLLRRRHVLVVPWTRYDDPQADPLYGQEVEPVRGAGADAGAGVGQGVRGRTGHGADRGLTVVGTASGGRVVQRAAPAPATGTPAPAPQPQPQPGRWST
jgi:hypothetical protein